MEAVRARAEGALFGGDAPARLGRYLVVEKLAGGGMGVVYRGYDPELHRKVALKVLHPRQHGDERAHARMLTEARALAKLDHPNVVRVHDVLGEAGQVVIVMELVEGVTLTAWEREAATPRPWRDIVATYLQAAQGLAAAHGVGVIHRDFKPANAIIGRDGRVRVLDFGLARSVDAPVANPLATGSPGAAHDAPDATGLTRTGEVVGTLGYTAPEQLAGEQAEPASDQFSFCVALHRALEGHPPFIGTTPDELLASIRTGRFERASSPRPLPPWLRTVVARGLRAAPGERFADMRALIDELERPRGWRRWRGVALAGAIVAAAGVAISLRPAATAAGPTCDGGGNEIATTWGDAQRAQVERVLGEPTARSVLAKLDQYGQEWAAMHDDACRAHHQGVQSDTILDERMACLLRRRVELQEAISVLTQTSPSSRGNAIDVAARLPDPTLCGDLEHLAAQSEPPTNPQQRALVDSVRASLGRAAALDRAGRSDEALAEVTLILTDAQRTTYAPVIVEAGLLRGRILLSRRNFPEAAPQLRETRALALENRLFAGATEAAARQIYAESMESADLDAIQRDAAIFEPLSESITGDHFARPLLLNNIGTAYMAAGRGSDAVRYFQLAHDALEGVDQPDLELTCIDKNLAMVTSDDAAREALAKSVWETRRAALGDVHIETLDALDSYARYLRDARAALAAMSNVCPAYDREYPGLIELRAQCYAYRSFLLEYLGDAQRARDSYAALARLDDKDEGARDWIALGRGEAARLRGDTASASDTLQRLVDATSESDDWLVRLRAAHAHLALARITPTVASRAHLEAAKTEYTHAVSLSAETEMQLRLQIVNTALGSKSLR
jgi:tetratricopeptide (TPR) repeat protein/predicted Ser/Thr protein kinase